MGPFATVGLSLDFAQHEGAPEQGSDHQGIGNEDQASQEVVKKIGQALHVHAWNSEK